MRGEGGKVLKDITYGVSMLFLQCVIDRGGSVEEKTRLEVSDTHKKTNFLMKSILKNVKKFRCIISFVIVATVCYFNLFILQGNKIMGTS